MSLRRILFFLLFLFLGIFLLYLHNLSRSIYGGDVGDLVTSAFTHGVAHPPGYPLFVFLGFVLSHGLFFIGTPAFRVGIVSAFFESFGAIVFFFLIYLLVKNKTAALLTTAILSFSFLYWFYGEIAEVFALNAFFAILLFCLAIVFKLKKTPQLLLTLFYVMGLSLTNHQTILFIFPSLFIIIATDALKILTRQKKILFFLPLAFGIGLLPYAYVPIASSLHPTINWDNVHDISSFLRLVFRQDYGTFQAGLFLAPTFAQRIVIVKEFFTYVIGQLTIPVVFFSLIGLIRLCFTDKRLGFALLVGFVISGPLFVGYAGFPVTSGFILGVYERFFLLPSILLLIPFPVGLLYILQKIALFLKRPAYIFLFQTVFFLIPIMLFIYNFPKTDLSHVFVGDLYAKDLLSPLPNNAFLSFAGDTPVFNTWYVHYVLNFRPDILIYNIGGGFEGGPINGAVNLARNKQKGLSQTDALLQVLEDVNRTHPVFSTILFQPSKGAKVTWIPYGLVYTLVNKGDPIPTENMFLQKTKEIWGKLHPPTPLQMQEKVYHNYTISEFPESYSDALLAVGTYIYSEYHDGSTAVEYYKKALAVDPTNPKAYQTIGIYYQTVAKDCTRAQENLEKSMTLNQFDKIPYFFLYQTYITCSKDPKKAQNLVKQYDTIFEKDFFKDTKDTLSNISQN